MKGLSPRQIDDLAWNAGFDILPGKVSGSNPAARYYAPDTKMTEGFRVLPGGVAGQPGVQAGPYLKYFGGSLNGQRVSAMIDPTNLRQALLDLGLEDWIELLHEGRIQIWAGHWSQESELVDPGTAEELLRDHKQYTFKSPADLRLRVYYVNVDNVLP